MGMLIFYLSCFVGAALSLAWMGHSLNKEALTGIYKGYGRDPRRRYPLPDSWIKEMKEHENKIRAERQSGEPL